MKKILVRLASIAGTALSILAALFASTYLFGAVLWMHAPVIPALLVTFVMVTPLLVLGWILRRPGRPPAPGPWYRIHDDGKLIRETSRRK